jgi:hypothetical protein
MKKLLAIPLLLALAFPAWAAQQTINTIDADMESIGHLKGAVNTEFVKIDANFDEVYAELLLTSSWVAQATAPADLTLLWIDTDQGNAIKYHDGSVWTVVGEYTLPIATAEALGGIRIGSGMTIDPATGVVSIDDQTAGLQQTLIAGSNITIAGDGVTISATVPEGTGDNLGAATATDVSALFSGSGDYLKSDGTKGTPAGGEATLPDADAADMIMVSDDDGEGGFPYGSHTTARLIKSTPTVPATMTGIIDIGSCDDGVSETEAACTGAAGTWTPVLALNVGIPQQEIDLTGITHLILDGGYAATGSEAPPGEEPPPEEPPGEDPLEWTVFDAFDTDTIGNYSQVGSPTGRVISVDTVAKNAKASSWTTEARAYHTGSLGSSDMEVVANIRAYSGSDHASVLLRVSETGGVISGYEITVSSNRIRVGTFEGASSLSQIEQSALLDLPATLNWYELRATIVGNTINVYFDGSVTPNMTVTDSTIATGTYAGFAMANSVGNNDIRVDDFRARTAE